MKTEIIVASHKPYRMPTDPMYLPLQVGAAGKDSIGFERDDTGDHISGKNANYCELTGLYWAWKNRDADAIGLVHYRRHLGLKRRKDRFASVLSGKDVDSILRDVPLILPKKRKYRIETVRSHFLHSHRPEGLDAAREAIESLCPEYLSAWDEVLSRTEAHMFNLFVMRRDVLDRYCSWLFPILFETERRMDLSDFSREEARVFGYLSEWMIDVWLLRNPMEYRELPVIYTEKQNLPKKAFLFLKRKFFPKEIH